MNADKIFTLLGSVVTVALVTTIAVHGTGFSQVLKSGGSAFSGILLAAQGQKV
jgi:hypothetical protein